MDKTEIYKSPVALWVACNFKVFHIKIFKKMGTILPIKNATNSKNPSNCSMYAQRL
jgi:hypothetical protein